MPLNDSFIISQNITDFFPYVNNMFGFLTINKDIHVGLVTVAMWSWSKHTAFLVAWSSA